MKSSKNNEISIFAPASVANVGCGFDVFAFALEEPGDEIHLKIKNDKGISISKISGIPSLPTEPHKNTAGVSLKAMLDYINADFGIEMEIHKKMPIKSGLGSSAASAVGSVFALNELLQLNLSNDILIKFAMEGEKIASYNQVHLDNISACLYGGFILARSQNPVDIISIPIPDDLNYVILHPHIDIDTSEARQILPRLIPLPGAVEQWANTAAMMTALFTKDYELLRRSITDNIIEPIRAREIPHFREMKALSLKTGAAGFGVSGSGPSVFALAESEHIARNIQNELVKMFGEKGLPFDTYRAKINTTGPRVLRIS